jgi:catechol 2,3-dioxygenase-like lactoylglutathione lyase family enzyme
MMIGIDHVQITVPPIVVAEARAFYCGPLGLREVEKPATLQGWGGFWLQVGDRQVHVGFLGCKGAPAPPAAEAGSLGRHDEY